MFFDDSFLCPELRQLMRNLVEMLLLCWNWKLFSHGSRLLYNIPCCDHYSGVMMGAMASQITSITTVYSNSGADQRKHQSSASLALVWEFTGQQVNSPHKWPVTSKKVYIRCRHHHNFWMRTFVYISFEVSFIGMMHSRCIAAKCIRIKSYQRRVISNDCQNDSSLRSFLRLTSIKTNPALMLVKYLGLGQEAMAYVVGFALFVRVGAGYSTWSTSNANAFQCNDVVMNNR